MMMNHTGTIVVGDTDTDSDSTRVYDADQPFSSCVLIRFPTETPSHTHFAVFRLCNQTVILAAVVVNTGTSDTRRNVEFQSASVRGPTQLCTSHVYAASSALFVQ